MSKIDLEARQSRALTSIRAKESETEGAGDGLTITAIGVPYGTETRIFEGFYEQFEPGSVDAEGAILRYGHTEPIGKITTTRDTDAGVEFEAVISKTTRGLEVAELIRDGVLTKCSIGFDGIERTEAWEGEELHVTWKKVRAREFSIVEFPAYEEAEITGQRAKNQTNQKETSMDTEITDRLETLERSLAAVKDKPATPQTPGLEFRSFGEYVAAYKDGNEAAKSLARAAATGTSTDFVNRPVWLGDIEKRMEAKQPLASLFTRVALPSTGLSMEYAVKDEATTIKTGKQATEGAKLPTGLPATWAVKSAQVNTYGGAVESITRQAIERTTSPVILDEIFKDLAYSYAVTIEAEVRGKFEALATDNTPVLTLEKGTASTVADLEDLLVDLFDIYDDLPYMMDGLLVSPEVFKWLKNLPRDPRALQLSTAPVEHQGTLTIQAPRADIGGVTIQRVKGWTGAQMAAYSKDAITLAEQPGAPLRLEDETVSTLTRDFAVYGYAAVFSQHPSLIKPVKIGA